ncbi:19285_t:CDS:2, partial [Funneliformis geosporum]
VKSKGEVGCYSECGRDCNDCCSQCNRHGLTQGVIAVVEGKLTSPSYGLKMISEDVKRGMREVDRGDRNEFICQIEDGSVYQSSKVKIMPKTSTLIVDKKTENGKFRCEERIKLPQFRVGIDYAVEGSMYFIFSNQLKKDILLTKNPYSDNVDDYVGDLEMKILVDHRDDINLKPKIVTDLEQRERLIEVGKGISDPRRGIGFSDRVREIESGKKDKRFRTNIGNRDVNAMIVDNPEILLTDEQISQANTEDLKSLLNRINSEFERRQTEENTDDFVVSSEQLRKFSQKLESVVSFSTPTSTDNSPKSNRILPAIGIISAVVGLCGGLIVFFKDLVITIDYLREELKRGADKLVAIEGELRLLRIEIMDKKGKFDDKIKK